MVYLTILHTSVVVGDENQTSLIINTNIVFLSTGILGLDNRKRLVNGDSLSIVNNLFGRIRIRSSLSHFCFNTCEVFCQDIRLFLKLGNTINKFVSRV